MLLKNTSQNFRKKVLLKFTEELLRNSAPIDVYKLDQTLQERPHPNIQRAQIKKILRKKQIERAKILNKLPERKLFKKPQKRILRVPPTRIPSSMKYLNPSTPNISIDLGKLNPLVKDPLVKDIQCNGQDTNIIVRGSMGEKTSKIILNKNEVNYVIEQFSKVSHIPIQEGFFKVAVGKMILSAIVSKVADSKFLIKKVSYKPMFNY
jgi:hypothetical protein